MSDKPRDDRSETWCSNPDSKRSDVKVARVELGERNQQDGGVDGQSCDPAEAHNYKLDVGTVRWYYVFQKLAGPSQSRNDAGKKGDQSSKQYNTHSDTFVGVNKTNRARSCIRGHGKASINLANPSIVEPGDRENRRHRKDCANNVPDPNAPRIVVVSLSQGNESGNLSSMLILYRVQNLNGNVQLVITHTSGDAIDAIKDSFGVGLVHVGNKKGLTLNGCTDNENPEKTLSTGFCYNAENLSVRRRFKRKYATVSGTVYSFALNSDTLGGGIHGRESF